MTQLEKLKLLLGIKDNTQDDLLQLLLDNEEDFIKNYCNRDTMPAGLLVLQVKLAVISYNRMGVEGETGRTEGGVSRSIYSDDDTPSSIRKQLNQYRLAKVIKVVE